MSRFEKMVVVCLLSISFALVGDVIGHLVGITLAMAVTGGMLFPGSCVDTFFDDVPKGKKPAQAPEKTG